MLLGVLLSWRALKRLFAAIKAMRPAPALRINSLTPLAADHVHSAHCGCGHRHLPSDSELQAGSDWRTQAAIVLAMGMRPCSGAILVLLFSKVIGVFGWGVISALAMAFGTSLTISMLALLVHYSRRLAVRLSRSRARGLERGGLGALALAGGLILLAAGCCCTSARSRNSAAASGPSPANGHKKRCIGSAFFDSLLAINASALRSALHAWWPAWLSLRAGCLQPRCRS